MNVKISDQSMKSIDGNLLSNLWKGLFNSIKENPICQMKSTPKT